jgi:thioredoxin reductase
MFDVIVVGGGFAGLSATMQLARARRHVLLVDAGLPRNRFAEASHGFLGQDGKAPARIMREAACQIAAYPTVEIEHGEALAAQAVADGFSVRLAGGRSFEARKLVLATGVTDILPDLPGLAERWGASVMHCPYCHGYEHRDRPLGVLASSAMAAHQAAMLPDWGPTTLFTQGRFEPDDEQLALLRARGVSIERSPVVALLGQAPDLEAARLADGRTLVLNGLFIAPGQKMSSPLAERLGCAFDEGPLGPIIRTDAWKATTIPGVYAAGDAARPMQNATLASADGVLAGVGAHQALIRDALPLAQAVGA